MKTLPSFTCPRLVWAKNLFNYNFVLWHVFKMSFCVYTNILSKTLFDSLLTAFSMRSFGGKSAVITSGFKALLSITSRASGHDWCVNDVPFKDHSLMFHLWRSVKVFTQLSKLRNRITSFIVSVVGSCVSFWFHVLHVFCLCSCVQMSRWGFSSQHQWSTRAKHLTQKLWSRMNPRCGRLGSSITFS